MKKSLVLIISTFLLGVFGCTGAAPKVDPLAAQLTPADAEMLTVPDVCKSYYTFDRPSVAITKFQNNTSYGNMVAVNTGGAQKVNAQTQSVGAVGVVGGYNAATLGYVGATNTNITSEENVNSYMREVAPNIGEYAQSATENIVSQIGGMKVFERTHLESILNEMKFQMSIADQDTIVSAGKLAGVKYIFAGTVDSISARYVAPDNSRTQSTGNSIFDLALSIGKVAANTQTGWIVNVELTAKLIDVETGQVVINQKVKGREVAGGGSALNPELIAEAAKKAMGEAVEDLKPVLSQRYSQKSYIKQLRGSKTVALIDMGTDAGIKPGEKLDIFDFVEVTDPFSGEKTCNMVNIPVTLTVSNQVSTNQAWVKIDNKSESIVRVKVGSIIKRPELKGQSVFKKMF